MKTLMPGQYSSLAHWPYEEKAPPYKGLLIAGAVVVGLGVLSWIYLGADLKRYMKIHSM